MKLYISQGTNPRVVELFLSRKKIEIEKVRVEIADGENRKPVFLGKNPLGELPVLELESGQCISQTTAICEYLEEVYPQIPLIGMNPEERAETRMWMRRIDLLIIEPVVNAFKFGDGLFYYESITHCIPGAVDDLKQIAADNIARFDQLLTGKTFICGERFTLADIQLFCFLDFFQNTGNSIDPKKRNITNWRDCVQACLV